MKRSKKGQAIRPERRTRAERGRLRTLLKRAFAKTGTSRQVDLVRLVMTAAIGHATANYQTPGAPSEVAKVGT